MNVTEDYQGHSSSSFNYSLANGTSGNGTMKGFQPLFPPGMDKAISGITITILFTTMISLGCTMKIDKIKHHIVRPSGVGIAVVAQFVIMPLSAFCLAKILQLGPTETMTVLICGCCPGGNLSNILALALQGDMNLSVVMTTCSTVLALGAMPLLLFLYCQGLANLENAVPYIKIFIALLMTLVPCAVGITINHWAPRYSQFIIKAGFCILLIASVVIGTICGITLGATVWIMLSPQILVVGSLMPFIGYLLGYTMSLIFKQNGPCSRTIAMETGCQNVQLCSAILKVTFPPDEIGPLFLFPVVYVIFQGAEALFLIMLFRIYQRFKPSAEGEISRQSDVNSNLNRRHKYDC
ncbi:hepatic sodium/bile acid cotransporter-like [Neoarius graeffei]|uniref:hepatic sodium/bile acid cotransporter-like n=1 Tax=Neoarius graeffei TaxID=443677 RepID=UPI00298D4A5A|nr:hepatic sodium/bile acid cotransporter-like [Neoarius graeffei]